METVRYQTLAARSRRAPRRRGLFIMTPFKLSLPGDIAIEVGLQIRPATRLLCFPISSPFTQGAQHLAGWLGHWVSPRLASG
jgi:hypothetical protein